MHDVGLLKAIRHFGSQAILANALGTSQQSVNHWLNREKQVPYIQALKIALLSDGTITLHELAPHETALNVFFQPVVNLKKTQPR